MPSVRFSRDKRGYEYVYLVHTPTRRGKPGRSRVLYWYRTPPGVRIGRKPFDEEVRRTLEQQNPGVTFDWEAIVSTPMPPPDMTEFWRERRRAEKAARQERRAMEAQEAAPVARVPEETPDVDEATPVAAAIEREASDDIPSQATPAAADAGDPLQSSRKRRRRRSRRRPAADAAMSSDAPPEPGEAVDVPSGEPGFTSEEEGSTSEEDDDS